MDIFVIYPIINIALIIQSHLMTNYAIITNLRDPFEKLVKIERNISTINYHKKNYHIEVGKEIGYFDVFVLSHSHSIKKYNLSCHEKGNDNAVFYFKLLDASYFNNCDLLESLKLFLHSHENKDTIYFLHKNNEIYEYKTGKAFNHTSNHLMHNHKITLLSITD